MKESIVINITVNIAGNEFKIIDSSNQELPVDISSSMAEQLKKEIDGELRARTKGPQKYFNRRRS